MPVARRRIENKKTPPFAMKRNDGAGTEKRPKSIDGRGIEVPQKTVMRPIPFKRVKEQFAVHL
jgi:hypothetical protein